MKREIGETFAGGIVFYLDGKGGGLVAAPTDQGGEAEWGGDGTEIGGGSTAVGTGAANAARIVNELGSGAYAAKICRDLVLDGYDDWFLPSKDELALMFRNLKKEGLGGFASDTYWSSSELNSGYAWDQYFGNGAQYHYPKGDYKRVRAVRAF